MMHCVKCKIHGPEKFIQQFLGQHEVFRLCPDCALEMRNYFHGSPVGAPFTGTMANELWEDFQQWKKRGQTKEG